MLDFDFASSVVVELNFAFGIKTKMERSISFNPRFDNELPNDRSSDIGYTANDRRLAYSRSFQQSHGPRTPAVTEAAKPFLDRTVSSIDMPPEIYSVDGNDVFSGEGKTVAAAGVGKVSVLLMVWEIYGVLRNGNRQMKRLFLLISLNVAYSTTELSIGLLTGRVGMNWCQVLTFCFIESLKQCVIT